MMNKKIEEFNKVIEKWFKYFELNVNSKSIDDTEGIMRITLNRLYTDLTVIGLKPIVSYNDKTKEEEIYVGLKDDKGNLYLFRSRVSKKTVQDRGRVLEYIFKKEDNIIKRYYSLLEGGYGFNTKKLDRLPNGSLNQVEMYMDKLKKLNKLD